MQSTIHNILLFIFPKFSFYKDGIILNDINQTMPQKIFSINNIKYKGRT